LAISLDSFSVSFVFFLLADSFIKMQITTEVIVKTNYSVLTKRKPWFNILLFLRSNQYKWHPLWRVNRTSGWRN